MKFNSALEAYEYAIVNKCMLDSEGKKLIADNGWYSFHYVKRVFKSICALNPSKDACLYWSVVNKTILNYSKEFVDLWKDEKQATVEAIKSAKTEALTFLASEREKIMRMSHDEALSELVKVHKIESREGVVKSASDNNILSIR